jgi:hypothetical protein
VVVLVIVLAVTNLATAGALVWLALRPSVEQPPDPVLAAALAALPRPAASSSAARRLITIEILNPIELAGARGRWAGIAGSLAPGLVRRLVYEQALRTVKRQLAAEQVIADVRLHEFAPRPELPRTGAAGQDGS